MLHNMKKKGFYELEWLACPSTNQINLTMAINFYSKSDLIDYSYKMKKQSTMLFNLVPLNSENEVEKYHLKNELVTQDNENESGVSFVDRDYDINLNSRFMPYGIYLSLEQLLIAELYELNESLMDSSDNQSAIAILTYKKDLVVQVFNAFKANLITDIATYAKAV